MTISSELYKYDLMDHVKNPRNYGLLLRYDFLFQQKNQMCGDVIVVSGIIQKGVIQCLTFEGSGCVLSIAMASKLTEYVRGLVVEKAMLLDEKVVETLLGMPLGINRMQCGLLSIKALQHGLCALKKG